MATCPCPLSTQQALQLAKAVDEELEDLKSLAKSLEEQNRGLLAQARQTVGPGQGVWGVLLLLLLPTFLESDRELEYRMGSGRGPPGFLCPTRLRL